MKGVTDNAKELYNEFNFGGFSDGLDRLETEPLLKIFLEKVDDKSILYDIGCGVGNWTEAYLKFNIPKNNIILVDIAPENIMALKRKGFRAREGNVLDLSIENNVADFTICNGVIHHTTDPFKAFKELVRITKSGGYIYLNVYNAWNPYFYIVHRATFPFRYWYWHLNKNIINFLYPISKIFFQPLSYVASGKFLDDRTGKILFMDQVMTPIAHLFTKNKIKNYADKFNCEIETIGFNKGYMMIASIIKVGSKLNGEGF